MLLSQISKSNTAFGAESIEKWKSVYVYKEVCLLVIVQEEHHSVDTEDIELLKQDGQSKYTVSRVASVG